MFLRIFTSLKSCATNLLYSVSTNKIPEYMTYKIFSISEVGLLVQDVFCFTVKFILTMCHKKLQVSISHLLNVGPGLPSKLFVMSQITLGRPPLKIRFFSDGTLVNFEQRM